MTITASACPAPTINSFTATPSSVTIGSNQTVRLAWAVTDNSASGVTVTISGIGTFGASGSVDIPQPQATTTYTLTATAGCGAQASAQTNVTASSCPVPVINSFIANPSTVTAGGSQSVVLSWSLSDPSGTGLTASIAGIGSWSGTSGSVTISQPQSNTVYTLTVTAGCGSQASANTTVSISPTITYNIGDDGPHTYTCDAFSNHLWEYTIKGIQLELTRSGDYVTVVVEWQPRLVMVLITSGGTA